MGEEELFCFEENLILFFFVDSLLIVSSCRLDPFFDLLGFAMTSLEYLKFNTLGSIFHNNSFNIFGDEFS